jgi:hypothetical protein
MAGGSDDSDLTGAELLRLANSRNTKQFKDVPLDELADWIKEQDLTADVLMISLLIDINNSLRELRKIKELAKDRNKELQKINY